MASDLAKRIAELVHADEQPVANTEAYNRKVAATALIVEGGLAELREERDRWHEIADERSEELIRMHEANVQLHEERGRIAKEVEDLRHALGQRYVRCAELREAAEIGLRSLERERTAALEVGLDVSEIDADITKIKKALGDE